MLKGKNKMMPYFLLIIYVLFSSLGMVLTKKGGGDSVIRINSKQFDVSISWLVFIGLLMYVISFVLWIFIIQRFPLTYISPISYGLVFISIAIFSYYILGVKITKEQFFGSLLIITGIIITIKK